MFSPLDDSMFILPVCYHPTTVLSVDDDVVFLKNLAMKVSDQILLLCFENPEEAVAYTKNKHHYLPFTDRCLTDRGNVTEFNLKALRNEKYNKNRFRQIFVIGTDFDMPGMDGVELVKTMEFPKEISRYRQIFLTGKISAEFKEKLAALGLSTEYIGKEDPQYIAKFLALVQKRAGKIFQWYSYAPARLLSKDPKEMTTFLFDGNFAPLFNSYVKDNSICEFYLFDKQGSYLFLDDRANLSWLFVRNDHGIENSIKMAAQYGAPSSVINTLKEKKVILSLYEKEDFEARKTINWDDYLLPATVFESDDKYVSFFPNPDTTDKTTPKYYYAFSKEFPEHDIKTNEIFTYHDFLES